MAWSGAFNRVFIGDLGGAKSTGIGREAGPAGFEAYIEPKPIGLSEALAEILTR